MSAAIMTIAVGNAYANPQDGIVSAGSATVTSSGNTLNIHQSTQKAIIDWRSFDIGASETTQFHQPSSFSVTLNRVHSSSPSFIDGHLIANGNIFIVNQNGVVFGQNSRVDVNGLVASTANISDANFMAGNFRFDQAGNPNATIENRGQITAAEAGLIGLVAPNVLNSGVIHAKLGRVHLASGDRATVDLYGDGLIEVSADDYAGQRVVQNTGKITAEGGTIAMTAAAGATMVNSLIRVSGELRAPSVGVKNGKIIIGAEGSNAVKGNVSANKGKKSGSSKVIVDGVMEASGKNPGEKGGSITITADHIEVLANALIDATGSAGGGRISIGGASIGILDASGGLPVIDQTAPVALSTTVQQNALIDASAIHAGDGGSVTVYSDEVTLIDGDIRAVGAGDDGNGGFADTSGHNALIVNGTVTLSGGRRGRKGEWLLDPADITITGPDTNISSGPNYTPTETGSQVSAASIVANLNAGTNVTITTANNAYAGNGDIFVNSAITATGSGSLTLSAYRDITVSSTITLNGGSLTLRADNSGADNGAISVSAGIATNGGNIIMGGGSGVISAGNGYAAGSATYVHGINVTSALNAGGGNIIINGKTRVTSLSNSYGVQISGTVTTTGAGTISLTGIARGNGNASYGYGLYLLNTVSSVNGNITLTGVGGGAGTGMASYGVAFSSTGGLARTTGTGNITVVGTGGVGSGGSQHGILFNNASNNLQATSTGTITVTGTAGTSNGSNNYGVNINGNIAGGGGAITINGTGATGTGAGNHGIIMSSSTVGASVTNSGSGSITFNGTGGGTGNSGSTYGVYFNNSAVVSTVNGALNVNGNGGGGGFGAYNYGIHLLSGILRSTGSGNITLVGNGGNNLGTGAYNSGIFIVTGGSVQSTGTGSISITATGANSSGGGIGGISLQGSVTSVGGAITITGTGGGSSGATNVGIRMNGGSVSNTGSGTVTLNGYGGGAGASSGNEGVLLQNGGNITTVNGALTINGTGGVGTGGSNHGIDVTTTGSSTLKTTGSGILTLNGTNGAGTGYGVTLVGVANAVQTTGTGAIRINTNSINADTASSVNSISSLTLSALTAGTTMGLGTGTGTMVVNDTTLNALNAASYIFGATNLGDMAINTTRDFGDRNVSFISGGNITLAGTLTKNSGTGTAAYLLQANGNVSNSGGAGIASPSGSVNVTFTSDNDVDGTGNIALTNAGLLSNNGTITLNSNGQTAALSGTIGGATTINSANGAVTLGSIDGTTAGTKDLTVNAGTGTFTTTGAIGFTNQLNNITITADDAVIGSTINGSGTLILRPTTTTRDFNVNYGTANGTNFHLNSTEISRIQGNWSQITLGRGTITGDLNVGTSTFSRNILFLSGVGGVSIRDGATVSTTNLASATFQAAGHVVLSGYVSADGNVTFSNGYSNYLFQSSLSGSTKYITSANGNIIFNKGIDLYSANAVLSAVNGSVIFAGGGISSSYSFTATAKSFSFGSSLASSAGNVTLNSTDSITIPTLTTTAGRAVTVNVSGAGNSITTTGAITTGANGNISLSADNLILGGNLSGTGTLTLTPYANDRIIRIADGTADFNLSQAEINYLTDGWSNINIGKSTLTGDMQLGASSWMDPVTFISNYRKRIYGLTGTGNASFKFNGAWIDLIGNITTAGGAVDFSAISTYLYSSPGATRTIATNGGNILFVSVNHNVNSADLVANSSGGNISVAGQIYSGTGSAEGKNITFNAGSGNISIAGTVNGGAGLTASGTNLTLSSGVGQVAAMGNINLTAQNSMTLPAITTIAGKTVNVTVAGAGNSITTIGAISTGANGNIIFTSDDLILGGNLSGTGTLTLRPYDNMRAVRIGGTGDFSLSAGEIGYFVNGWNQINIGRTDSTTRNYIAVDSPISFQDNVTIRQTQGGLYTALTMTDGASFSVTGNIDIYGDIITDGGNVSVGNIAYGGGGTITTSGGNVILYNLSTWDARPGMAINTNGGNITITNNLQQGGVSSGVRAFNLNAGTGTISFGNTVNTGASITATAASILFNGAWGGSVPLGNVHLTTVNSVNLPSINASRITVQTTGVASDVILNSGTILTASGAGDAITLVAGRNFVNSSGSSTPFNLTGSGRWLTYSTNPTQDTVNGLSSNFVRYGCTYGGSCPTGVTIPGTGNGSIYIYRPTLTVTPTSLASLIYGDAAPSLAGYAYDVTGYITGAAGNDETADSLTGSLSGSTSYTSLSDVGTYGVNYASGTLLSALGYDVIYANNTNAITVNKKALTVTANNQSVTYGTAVPMGSVSYTGFVNGQDISVLDSLATLSSANSGIINAGTYTNNYTVSGAADNNYSFNYVSGNLTVNKKTLDVTADNQTITYGDAIPATTTISYNGFISGEDESDLITAPTTVSALSGLQNAGTYTNNYTVSGGVSNNYDFNYLSGDLIIAKKDLAVSADNKSVSYGSAVPTGSLTYSGFITGQDETFLDTQPIVTSANNGILNAGTYAGNYVASGGTDSNYNLIYSSGTLTVTKIGVNVIVNNRSVIYGTAVPTTTLSYSGFVNGDTESDLLTQATITSSASGIVNAGSYIGNYTASGAGSDNYTFNYIAGDLTVNKKLLNVTASNRTATYGDALPTTTLVYNGFISGEDVSFLTTAPIVTSLQSGVVNAGSYTGNYVPSGGVSNNYSFNYISGNLNVVKKNLVVTANSVVISYGNVIPGTTTLIYSGFVSGDNVSDLNTAPTATSTLSGIQNSGTYTGNYIVGGASDNNYSFTYIHGDLVIGGSMAIPPSPPAPTTSDLPNTFIYSFQNPEVSSVVNSAGPKQVSISYSIRSDSAFDNGNSFIEITPELANIFEITQEDIQNLNVSKTIH